MNKNLEYLDTHFIDFDLNEEAEYKIWHLIDTYQSEKESGRPLKGLLLTCSRNISAGGIITQVSKAFVGFNHILFQYNNKVTQESIKNVYSEARKKAPCIVAFYDNNNDEHLISDSDRSLISLPVIGPAICKEMENAEEEILTIAVRYKDEATKENDKLVFGLNHFTKEVKIEPKIYEYHEIAKILKQFADDYDYKYDDVDLYNLAKRINKATLQEIANLFYDANNSIVKDLKITDLCPENPVNTFIVDANKRPYKGEVSYRNCLSEAGHILVAYNHLENTQFKKCEFDDYNHSISYFYHYPECVNEKYKKENAFSTPILEETRIKIALAGYLSELTKYDSINGDDSIRYKRIINNSLDNLAHYYNKDDSLSFKEKLFKKYESDTKKWLKKHHDELIKLADYIYKNKGATKSELDAYFKI